MIACVMRIAHVAKFRNFASSALSLALKSLIQNGSSSSAAREGSTINPHTTGLKWQKCR